MSNNPDNPELPDGSDPIALPVTQRGEGSSARPYRNYGKRAFSISTSPSSVLAAVPQMPGTLSQSQNPVQVLAALFDMATAVSAILEEEFHFSELYRTYIDLFRNDPDPKIRMAAGDRIVKMIKDTLVAGGAVTQTVDRLTIRSPDGTSAERSVINRSIIRSFQEDSNHVRSQAEIVEPLRLEVVEDPNPIPIVADLPTVDGADS